MHPLRHLFAASLVFVAACLSARGDEGKTSDAKRVFNERILPIFKSPDPSSCVQCHLSGVDLKNYIRPTHEETFLSLRDQGLIDFDRPELSKILTLIKMGEKDTPGASLIHEKTRTAEYEAFAAWIKASASDDKLRFSPKLATNKLAQPERPLEVIRHARKDRLLSSFENSIWAMRFRCMGCHTEGSEQNKKLVAEHGPQVAWMKTEGAEATLSYLRESELIDLENPEKSLLLLKPLGEVKHGGGKKMLAGDQGYKAYRAFLEDYAKVIKDEYRERGALPDTDTKQIRFGSGAWLRLVNTPPAWGGHLVEVDVYAWDEKAQNWEANPIASSDRGIGEKGTVWQHTITLFAEEGSERAKEWKAKRAALPKGKYLLKVYVDSKDKLAGDWNAKIEPSDYVGLVEVEADWPEAPGKFTTGDASMLKK